MGEWRKGEDLRVSGAVRTTNMFTVRANLHSGHEKRRALVTRPPNPLHDLLPHQRLPTSPTWHREEVLLPHTPIRIRLKSTLNRFLRGIILLALRSLRLCLLHGIARTLGAARVLTCSTDFVPAECGLALVACPMDAHPDWLLDAHSFSVGPGGELVRFDGREIEAFAQFIGPLGVDLRPHYLHGLRCIMGGDGCGCFFDWSRGRCRFGSCGCT